MAGVYNMQEMTGTKNIYRLLPGGARWNHLVPGDTRCLVDMEMVDMDMMVMPGGTRWYKVGPGVARWFEMFQYIII